MEKMLSANMRGARVKLFGLFWELRERESDVNYLSVNSTAGIGRTGPQRRKKQKEN